MASGAILSLLLVLAAPSVPHRATQYTTQNGDSTTEPSIAETHLTAGQALEILENVTSEQLVLPTSQKTAVPTSQETLVPTSQETVVPISQETLTTFAQFLPASNLDNGTIEELLTRTSKDTVPPTSQEIVLLTSKETVVSESEETMAPISQDILVPSLQESVLPPTQGTVVPTSKESVLPTSQYNIVPQSQETGVPESQGTIVPISQESVLPTSQYNIVPPSQETGVPESQGTVVPTSQESVLPTSQYNIVPTSQEIALPTSKETVATMAEKTTVPTSAALERTNPFGVSEMMTSQNETAASTSTSELVNGNGRDADMCSVCDCWSGEGAAVDMLCRLPATGAALSVKGQPGSWLQIECQDESSFTCEQLPDMPLGLNSSIRLELRYCAPPRLACLAPRLHARLTHLYLFYLPHTNTLSGEMLRGLDHLERFAYFGEKVDNNSIYLPREAFASRPSLRSLTVNKVRLQLRGHDLDGVSGLEYLELSNVALTSLPPAIFAKLSKLKKLNLWKNQIEELSREDLQGLSSLQQLDISANWLRSLAPIAAGLPSLAALAARENPIEALTPLTNLQHLQQLQLFSNKIPLSISAGALASLPNLTSVDLRMNSITLLPEDLLHNSSALKTLKLCNNNISELPPGLFRDLQALEELDLSSNQLATLRPRGFEALTALKNLNLNNNRFTILPSYMVWGLCGLQRLWVSGCGVGGAGAGALSCGGRGGLQHLDLSRNRLVSLAHTHTYPHAQDIQYQNVGSVLGAVSDTLRSLDLSHNRLTAPPPDVHAFVNLRTLDVSHNNLTELLPHDLKFISASAEVDYRYNAISSVRVSAALAPGARLPAPWSAGQRATMRLDHNPFHCDCRLYHFATRLHGYISPDTTESHIDVGSAICVAPPELLNRTLATVPLEGFACSSHLIPEVPCAQNCSCIYRPHINAVQLNCTEVPTKPDTNIIPGVHFELALTQPHFNEFTFDVRVLNLSGLALKNVPETLPQGLRLLDLTNNDLNVIPIGLLESDIKLRLAGNKLKCDCSHKYALRSLKEFWRNIEDGSDVICSNGVPFTDISVDALCSTRTAVLIGVPLALLGLLTAVLALIFLRYNLEIRVWLHAKGLFKHWYAIDDENRTYDAFVSFCHKDEKFVTEQLIPGLEKGENGSGPYKLCIHYRDWVPGEWIPAQIARSVADSRRTIIVVSKNFLDSLWGRAEFRTANMSAIKERQTRVIVILLEDISSHRELDPELKAYLSTNTYLKWGDPWFWQKLRYALPHRRQATQTNGANDKSKSKTREKNKESKETGKGLKGVTGLPETLSPAGLLVPAAVPPNFVNKCEQFDIEIGNLKGMDIADLKSIKTVS